MQHHTTTRIGATLFSGGRLAEAMLTDLIDFRYAVEYDPQIAAVGAQLGGHTFVGRVQDVDYSTWGALDYLHASPVCKEFSQAKTGGAEGDEEITSAQAVVRCIEQTQPRVVTIENVQGYLHSRSFRLLCQALDRGGYMWHAEVLNSADFGVAQTRRRLIVRAVRDALLPGLPAPVKWVGWYEAIEDLIPGLPESRFADWQLSRLGNMRETFLMRGDNSQQEITPERQYRRIVEPAPTVRTSAEPRAFIVSNAATEYGDGLRYGDEPCHAVTTQANGRTRAFLVDSFNTSRDFTTRDEAEPAFTIFANHMRRPSSDPRAWLSSGKVVKMTPRALARFQSLPDSYTLPDRASLACTVIGNGVPSLLMREIVTPLI